ncbi:MAG TPA: PAS domain S-box protein [Candidatus Limnocylindrales bacterium]|jgi:PAS domain S-box-containing protein|nr:PAS domain S-box protein [Candidatus Limnocylindrales bacterium]
MAEFAKRIVRGPKKGESVANVERMETVERLARLVDLAPAATIVRQLDGMITFWSHGAERLYGWSKEEVLGRRTHELLRTEFPEALENIVAKVRRGKIWQGELRHCTRDGRRITVQSYWLAELDSDGEVTELLESNLDITERKRMEEVLREAEARFRALAENIPQLIWMTDADGAITFYNQRWFDYTGTTLQEMQEAGWGKVHHPEHVDRVAQKWNEHLRTGEPWEDTFPLRGKDGTFRWFLSRAFPIRSADGRISQWFGTNTDITELRETHVALEAAQAKLEEHARTLEATVQARTAELREANAELEAFCYSLSHDMRGPLRAIRSYTEMVIEDSGAQLSAIAKDYLQRVSSAAVRLDRLIQDVLAFSRVSRDPGKPERVEPERVVRTIISERPDMQPPAAEIRIDGPLPMVRGNEASLTQCLTNLLSNAVKFVAPGVTPHVRIHSETKGDRVRLWVEDNGIGINKEAQGKIFELFYRLHRSGEYEGTGLGLAIVRKAAERMGGQVGVESEPGAGSRFWVELSLAEQC